MKSTSFEKLGTKFFLKLPKEALFSFCFFELERIEQKYSRFLETSLLTKINNTKGWQEVDDETLNIISKGLEYNKNTDKYFSLTVKQALDKAGYDKEYSFKEKKTIILPSIKSPIEIKNNKIKITKPLDFGGLGKGYALDKLAQILDKKNVEKYFINGGGDIKVKGEWEIILEHPDDQSRAIGKIIIKDKSLASSSSNRRNWGKNNHHLINPKTKKPSKSDIKSIFVLATNAIDADAYATAFFVMGFEKAKEIAKKVGVEVLIITTSDQVYLSKEFNAEIY